VWHKLLRTRRQQHLTDRKNGSETNTSHISYEERKINWKLRVRTGQIHTIFEFILNFTKLQISSSPSVILMLAFTLKLLFRRILIIIIKFGVRPLPRPFGVAGKFQRHHLFIMYKSRDIQVLML
jgi:hypothetical protein